MFLDDTALAPRPLRPDMDRTGIWTLPRVALASGRRAALAIRFFPAASPEAATEAACGLARSSGVAVSLAARPPFLVYPELISAALQRHGLAPGRLELTVSPGDLDESAADAPAALAVLRKAGIPTAMENFCHRSLAWLPRLPLTRVLLAPELVHDVPGLPSATRRLHSLVALVRHHGVKVTATDIDTEIQRAILSGFGCDEGEGALFGIAEPVNMLQCGTG